MQMTAELLNIQAVDLIRQFDPAHFDPTRGIDHCLQRFGAEGVTNVEICTHLQIKLQPFKTATQYLDAIITAYRKKDLSDAGIYLRLKKWTQLRTPKTQPYHQAIATALALLEAT